MNIPRIYICSQAVSQFAHLSADCNLPKTSVLVFSEPFELLKQLRKDQMACVVFDLERDSIFGLDALRAIRSSATAVPIIVISTNTDTQLVVESMKLGASNFLAKPFSSSYLAKVVISELEKQKSRMNEVQEIYRISASLEKLSTREKQISAFLIFGLSASEIGAKLGISTKTVENHRFSILKKVEARNVPDLVRMIMLSRLAQNDLSASIDHALPSLGMTHSDEVGQVP